MRKKRNWRKKPSPAYPYLGRPATGRLGALPCEVAPRKQIKCCPDPPGGPCRWNRPLICVRVMPSFPADRSARRISSAIGSPRLAPNTCCALASQYSHTESAATEVRFVDLRLLVQQGVDHGQPHYLRLSTGRRRAEKPGHAFTQTRIDTFPVSPCGLGHCHPADTPGGASSFLKTARKSVTTLSGRSSPPNGRHLERLTHRNRKRLANPFAVSVCVSSARSSSTVTWPMIAMCAPVAVIGSFLVESRQVPGVPCAAHRGRQGIALPRHDTRDSRELRLNDQQALVRHA